MNLRRLGLASLLLLALSPAAWADGVIRDGVGPIASGRGGTNIAFGDNGAVIMSNPAGMSFMSTPMLGGPRPRDGWIEGGIDVLVTDLDFSNPRNHGAGDAQVFPLPQVAYMQRIGDSPWTAGIGAFAPAGFGSNWNLNGPAPMSGPQGYKSLGGLGQILPALSCQVTDDLAIGGTLGVAVSQAELEGPFFLQTGPLRGVPSHIDLQGMGAALSWSVGMQYRLSERTIIGAVYQSQNRFQFSGHGNVRADVYGLAPIPLSSAFDGKIDLVWPRSVGIGVQHWLADQHRIGVDVLWYDWSSAFNRLDMQLTNPTNPMFAMLGPAVRDSFPLNWRDSISTRLGYEYFWTPNDIVRAGYVYNTSTVPNGTLTPFIPAVLNHTISVGYSRVWNDYWFNFAYQFMCGNGGQSVGVSDLAGGDFSNSYNRAFAHVMMFSIGRGW